MNKKIGAAAALIILLAGAFFFRNKISFWRGERAKSDEEQKSAFSDDSRDTDTASSTSVAGEMKNAGKTPPASSYPAYRGRPAGEIRPDPKAVALFTAAQKDNLYDDIKKAAEMVKETPDYAQAWLQIGILKKTIGDFQGARDAWEYAALLRPESAVPFANLGELYWHYLPDYARAEANFKKAVKNDPKNTSVLITLSDFYFTAYKEKAALAESTLLNGMQTIGQNTELMRALGYLYERKGEYAKALEWWRKVLAREPQNASVKATIEELQKKIGS